MNNERYSFTLKKYVGHLHTVNKHRFIVFILACKAGIPWRGLTHDLSKYSPVEFFSSVKYYQGGKKSPIPIQRNIEGLSTAWLHHKGRNKHHVEYWYDVDAIEQTPIIPYKYVVEMICDKLSASITYLGKEWTKESELKYWKEKERDQILINKNISNMLDEVFLKISEVGIYKTLNKRYLKKTYNKYCCKGEK